MMTAKILPSPQPDWCKDRVFIVSPAIWPEYRRTAIQIVFDQLQAALAALGVEVEVLRRYDHPLDIWIRDYGFVENTFFRYAPSYARAVYSEGAIERARNCLSAICKREFSTSAMILDGGNLVHDGRVAIITEKFLNDNPAVSTEEAEGAIRAMGFEEVIFIPAEPGDTMGHADGVVRFIAPGLLLMNDYEGSEFEGYGRAVRSRLKSVTGIEIVPFPWKGTNTKFHGIWSAEGCYVNFLVTAGGVVFPTFGHRCDERALQTLSQFYSGTIVPVPASALARLGGVLGCVTLPM